MRSFVLRLAGLIVALGCAHSSEPPVPPGPGELLVGPDGGTLEFGAGSLTIPAGALEDEITLTARPTDAPAPDGFHALSPVYDFGPDGTIFADAATVRIPFEGNAEHAAIFWTNASNGAYVALDTTIEDGFAVARVEHFSSGFVATACDEGCCGQPSDKLDVLLVVDNSASMWEEQELLAAQIPGIAHAFATGDSNGDGAQDFPAVANLHMGVVTTDMGAGGFLNFACDEPNFGDDGVLLTAPDSGFEGCAESYDPIHEYNANDPEADPDAFAQGVACVARIGALGCGFEQQLEAPLKALTPGTSDVLFYNGTVGHGDNLNAGFLRDDAVLVVLVLTDENDCSAGEPEIFNPNSSVATGLPNLRCHDYASMLHDVSRYVDGLRSLKADGSQIVFAAIAGIPEDLSNGAANWATILDDPRMQEQTSETDPNMLEPACNTPNGTAFPARRLVETAQGLDGSGVIGSICSPDFSSTMNAILGETAARVAGSCSH